MSIEATNTGHRERRRAVRTSRFAGPEFIELVEVPTRAVESGEVRIRVEASSATTSDSVVRRGLSPYLGALEPPLTLGYDFVGVVEERSDQLSGFEVGDRVVSIMRWGANSDQVVLSAAQLTRIDSSVDSALIEPMVMTGATAATMVRRLSPVRAGDVVYVQGGSGGVGLLAVQASLALGARVIASASAAKLGVLSALGAETVDYTDPSLYEQVREFAPDGVQLVVDGAGGANVGLAAQVLADGGTLITYGFSQVGRRGLARSPEVLDIAGRAFAQSTEGIAAINSSPRGLRALQFDITGQREQDPAGYSEDVHWLVGLVESGRLRPVVETVGLEEAAAAHRRIDAGEVTGRLVLDHRIA